ncbi:MAG TPA: hypothetical protein VMF08_21290 [Candidatus Sulfotelmatobacter sp.]|nr:hypothetical protein [Candidatus Sulfotelmatobacter sp.]
MKIPSRFHPSHPLWKRTKRHFAILALPAILLLTFSSFAESTDEANRYWAVPISSKNGPTINRYGVPFVEGTLVFQGQSPARLKIGGVARRIYFLGMTESAKIGGWSDPTNYSVRYFIGDELGRIQLNYADGTQQVFPLILGQSVWLGGPFNRCPEPLSKGARQPEALAAALRLCPPAPIHDADYVAVITPRPVPLQSIIVETSPAKKGTPVIAGITLEPDGTNEIAGTIPLTGGTISPAFAKFAATKPLRSLGEQENQTRRELKNLERSFYSSDESFKGHTAPQVPQGYAGPEVSFKGSLAAETLANAFSYNVQDMLDKIDEDGMYHTSTRDAVWWRDDGLGSTNTGKYYDQCWSRDMGRSLEELSELGYTNAALRSADYSLRMARLWENPSLKVGGEILPPHWGRVVNKPDKHIAFENDGHGLIIMFLYRLWERLPNRDEWLRDRWPDIKASGDWILWQFNHPKISGAIDGSLHTTGESASGSGHSVYPDVICMHALRALAQMAESISETDSAEQWQQCADKMQAAITSHYIVSDPKYGRIWTLEHAGWPFKSTVLGPLVFLADYDGFAPEQEKDNWRPVNEAAYQRLVDSYQPFGFYGLTMGYGQGFVTQSALLLDRMHDATRMVDWAAKEIYDPRFGSFIVSEGVQLDPTGRFWYRFGDLGNGVQEAEIVKMLRLVIGVDDTHPDRLQFYPRMPYDWNEITVRKYPVLVENARSMETSFLNYQLKRVGEGMELKISADQALNSVAMRLGPFEKQPELSNIRVNGHIPTDASIERSGDSWWVRFTSDIETAEQHHF